MGQQRGIIHPASWWRTRACCEVHRVSWTEMMPPSDSLESHQSNQFISTIPVTVLVSVPRSRPTSQELWPRTLLPLTSTPPEDTARATLTRLQSTPPMLAATQAAAATEVTQVSILFSELASMISDDQRNAFTWSVTAIELSLNAFFSSRSSPHAGYGSSYGGQSWGGY